MLHSIYNVNVGGAYLTCLDTSEHKTTYNNDIMKFYMLFYSVLTNLPSVSNTYRHHTKFIIKYLNNSFLFCILWWNMSGTRKKKMFHWWNKSHPFRIPDIEVLKHFENAKTFMLFDRKCVSLKSTN